MRPPFSGDLDAFLLAINRATSTGSKKATAGCPRDGQLPFMDIRVNAGVSAYPQISNFS
jgi:hypothetical protein